MEPVLALLHIDASYLIALALVAFYASARFNTPRSVRSQTSRFQYLGSYAMYVISCLGLLITLTWVLGRRPGLLGFLHTGSSAALPDELSSLDACRAHAHGPIGGDGTGGARGLGLSGQPSLLAATGTWPRRTAKHGHDEAERPHPAAAVAHEAAVAAPMDTFSAEGAMQASNRADDASQAAGGKASTGWPLG